MRGSRRGLPTPAASAQPEPATAPLRTGGGGTVTVGTTSTSSFATKAQWIVFALILVAAPVPFLLGDSEGDDGGDRSTEMADQPTPEDTGAPPANGGREPRVAPGVVKLAAEDRALVGTWAPDREALERRLKEMRTDRKRPPRFMQQRREIERALQGALELELGEDGRFRIRNPALDAKHGEPIAGSWQRAGDVVVFTPDEGRTAPVVKKAGEPFQGRVREGRLSLVRRGFELPLRKR